MLKILLVDDHILLRHGLKKIIDDSFNEVFYGEAGNSADAIKLMIKHHWDIVVLDINIPGRNGIDVIKELRTRNFNTPVLVLSMYPEEQFALRVIKAGAQGYLTKNSVPTEIVEAIKSLLNGKQYITEPVAQILISELRNEAQLNAHDILSNRELQVLQLIGKGLSVSQIGKELSLSVKTISTYRTNILAKMNMKSNADIIFYVIKNNLIE
jgi:DNA-binding NarL/FixJ family response regulator